MQFKITLSALRYVDSFLFEMRVFLFTQVRWEVIFWALKLSFLYILVEKPQKSSSVIHSVTYRGFKIVKIGYFQNIFSYFLSILYSKKGLQTTRVVLANLGRIFYLGVYISTTLLNLSWILALIYLLFKCLCSSLLEFGNIYN